MDVSLFISRRLRFKGRIAMFSVAISFLVMIIAVSVSSGFRHEIRSSLSRISGDVQLVSPYMNIMDVESPVESDAAYVPYIEELPEVKSMIPTAYRAGIIKSSDDIQGILLKGVPSSDSVSLSVSIPSRLAEITGLRPGDKMLTYFVGDNVKARQFNVTSVYESMVEADDRLVVYADLADIQRVNGWQANQVSAIEIILGNKDEASVGEACGKIGTIVNSYSSDEDSAVVAVSSTEKYPQLFDWLNLIDFNVVFILALMTIVAGFNMISGLLIMLFENISTIGLLKSLGMTDKAISKVFLSSSAVLILKGMTLGNVLAVALCAIQDMTHILKLNPENYFVSYVPVNIDVPTILAADVISFAAIMILLLIPCLFIAKVDPADTVRVK